MRKQEFLGQLRKGLATLPPNDIAEHLAFYNEMIDDRMEEGLSEEDAVAAVGSVEKIIGQIVAESPSAVITNIESVKESDVLDFIEKNLWLIPLAPRDNEYDVLADTRIDTEGAKRLALAAEECWKALLAKDINA